MKDSLSVLVIDDDPGVLKAVEFSLRGARWTVATTTDPKQGVELARSSHPDVIVCDASMPNFSGSQLIGILKSDPATEGIPVVLMTGMADASMFSDIAWSGFLAKPFGPTELRAAIESAAARRTPPVIK